MEKKVIEEKKASYFAERMKLLGVTEKLNRVDIYYHDQEKNGNVLKPVPVFREVEKGIEIFVYTLARGAIKYAREEGRWKNKDYSIIRLKDPIVKPNGDTIKYLIPKGQNTHPFFPPMLLEKFEKKEHIPTIYFTEGYFKAWKACMHGIPCIGVSSITHLKDKETGALPGDCLQLLKTCTVERAVWLTDGDALDITPKEIKDGMDLYKRPKGFFMSAQTFVNLLSDNIDIQKWFAHMNSEALPDKPKGLDDMLVAMNGKEGDVAEDLLSFSRPGLYAVKMDITFTTGKLLRYFHLDNKDDFYLYHVQKRPEIKEKEFIWNGTRYKWDDEKSECKIIVPGEAKNYFRVGDQYHKFIEIPNKYGELERIFHRRMKRTITDDYGYELIKHIPRYEAFCNVPDHINYQQVIYNNFNIYAPFEHEPAEEECTEQDCSNIISFLTHIFGSGEIDWTHPKTREKRKISEVDLGLDFIQLLYQKPTQILPILCLVSRENNTGKTTLAKLFKLIFTANVAIVGNAELSDNFNASWASKLLIICDEAKIDKQIVVEKVKSLSTADKIMMNAKGKDHIEIDFFGKFLFLTNNEDNFIYASDDDVRYWVRKIPTVKDLNVDLITDMIEEIPAFLSFLNRRKLTTERLHRHWFDPALIRTDALRKVIAYSMPTIEKDLRQFVRDKFLDFGMDELMMTRKALHEDCFNRKYEANYLETVLKDRMKVDLYHQYEYDGQKFATIEAAGEHARVKYENAELAMLQAVKMYKSHRHSYPRWEVNRNDKDNAESKRVDVYDNGRPYVFHKNKFLTEDEIKHTEIDAEQEYISKNVMEDNTLPLSSQRGTLQLEIKEKDDLPF
ncbi:MAG TPA: primase-helicase family protein [Bacteroidia bacterium]|nr:primase-helicase family protein [Bacteroidia bacterium]